MTSKERTIEKLIVNKQGALAHVISNFGDVGLPTIVQFSKKDTKRLLKGENVPGSLESTIYRVGKETKIVNE